MSTERQLPWQSVRGRTTITSVCVVAAALAVGGFGLVHLLRDRLVDAIDRSAATRALDIASLVEQGSLPAELELPGDESSVLQVTGPDGSVVASTASRLLDVPDIASAADDHTDDEDDDVSLGDGIALEVDDVDDDSSDDTDGTDDGDRIDVRVATVVVDQPDGRYVVRAAESREDADETIGAVTSSLLAGVPILLVLVGLLAWRTTRTALQPVHRITREAASLGAADLSARVAVPTTADEIRDLAVTMNEMLGRIERAMERQRRFTADASHELRSPIASIRTQIDVAAMDPTGVSVAQAAPDLLAELDRVELLRADLLTMARLDASPPAMAPVDLRELITEAISSRSPTAVIVRQRNGGDDEVIVQGARAHLLRMLRNALDNGERHARSTIEIDLSRRGDDAVLVIADDGAGIDQADRDRVFERFTRLDDARSQSSGGSGLGLAIVRGIVLQHGGTIAFIDPEPERTGARLRITLPLAG
jgi:signal transduction histidine kinase